MKKYPFVKQQELKDCAASCMLMILKYYGAYVSIEELRQVTNTDKNGVNIYDLVEAFKQYGFESSALKGNIENIRQEEIICPFIAHIIKNNLGHYIVVYEINFKKNKVVIGDPGSKLKTITISEFLENWNNIIITMYPIKKLPYKSEKISIKNYILYFLKQQKQNIYEVCIFSLIVTILTICTTYYFQFIIDAVNTKKENSYLIFICICFILLGLIKEITSYIKNKIYNYVKYNLDIEMNYDVYKKMLFLPFKYYADRSIGDILERVNNLNNIKTFMCDIILNYIIGIFISTISFILLLNISAQLLLLSLLNILIYFIITFIFNKYFKEKINDLQISKADEISYLTETISSYNTIKGINLYNYALQKYKNKLRKSSYKYLNLMNVNEIMKFLESTVSYIFSVLIIYFGAKLINKGEITLGNLITFNYLFNYMFEPIKNILESNISLSEIKTSIKRIIDLYYYEDDEPKGKPEEGNIKIQNLNFAYNYNKVLKNINLEIKRNEKIMVIGESGSGKSSLFKLILKYYKVNPNNILIDNIDINDISKYELSKEISYISQNETLFNDNLYNNLTLDSNVTQKEVDDISKKTYVNEITNNLGYKMIIEENGFNLSGGEKMRIVLARTLLRKPKILIIDEGLNTVDTSLERKILKNILNENMTIIFISHRLDNMDLFKRIIEIKKGRIIKDVSVCNTN